MRVGPISFLLAGRGVVRDGRVVPRFLLSRLVDTPELVATRAVCDGCDLARPCEEHSRSAAIWLVMRGAFELRDRTGKHVLDPTHALVVPTNHAFVIRHPKGPDTCLAFRGALIDRLVANEPAASSVTPTTAGQTATLATELAAWSRGEGDELALGDALAALAAPSSEVAADDVLAGAVAHVLRLGFAESTSLGELSERTGYSVFHTCRVFRATTGYTIHGFRRELRLRHALARILDGDEPLIEIAAHTGFASQSHLTNLFRARFGVTPAKARTRDGMRRLTA